MNDHTEMNTTPSIVTAYGYERTDASIRCLSCGATFPRADGSVMRGHAKRCPVDPREFPVPGVCETSRMNGC